ncbi:MAG: thioesterase domain-containing protein [Phycisphaerales bacterium]
MAEPAQTHAPNRPDGHAHEDAAPDRGPRPRLILMPGMGTDGRALQPQRAIDADVTVLEWLEPDEREPLDRYAGRLADGLDLKGTADRKAPPPSVAPGSVGPLYVGGVSLGAMIALELGRVLHARRERTGAPVAGIFIIGGAQSGEQIATPLRCSAWLARHTVFPRVLVRPSLPIVARFVKFSEGLDDEQRRLVRDMLQDLSTPMLRWQATAACAWALDGDPAAPVHSIHGAQDGVITRQEGEVDQMVEGGKHLINMTHADEVNAFIEARMAAAGA